MDAQAGRGRRQDRGALPRPQRHARLLARAGSHARGLRRGRLLLHRRRGAVDRRGRHPPRPALRRPHRGRLQARDRHLRERRPAAREDHRGRRALRAGRGAHRHQPEGSRRADLPDAGGARSSPASRADAPLQQVLESAPVQAHFQQLLDTLAASEHRQRQPHRARCTSCPSRPRSTRAKSPTRARSTSAPCSSTAPRWSTPCTPARCPSRSSPDRPTRRHKP